MTAPNSPTPDTRDAWTDAQIEAAARALCAKFDPAASLDEAINGTRWRRFLDEARTALEAAIGATP